MNYQHNKHQFITCVSLLLSLTYSLLTQAATRQEIQELRTLSYSVTNNILVYYNPNGTPYTLGNKEAYLGGSKRLLLLSALLDLPEVTTQVKLLDETIADLRHLPQSASDIRDSLPPYSSWIPQIIDQQDRLLTLLSEQYARQPAISEMQQELHGLSQDVGRLSVAYQLDAFTYLVAQQWMLDREAVIKLDASILQRFSDLSAREPALSVTLGKMLGRYNFVRGYLLKPDKGWAPSAVERYLMSVANDIDNTASTLKP